MTRDPWLAPACWHPSATRTCTSCGGTGWIRAPRPDPEGAPPRWRACSCVGPCVPCGDSGFQAGGLEYCRCRVGRERVALLEGAELPDLAVMGDLPAEAEAWFARYRPEDGFPWLTLVGWDPGATVQALAGLVTGIGAPVTRIQPADPRGDTRPFQRIVACLQAEAVGEDRVRRILGRCQAEDRTLVLACGARPGARRVEDAFPLGESMLYDLWEKGTLVWRSEDADRP